MLIEIDGKVSKLNGDTTQTHKQWTDCLCLHHQQLSTVRISLYYGVVCVCVCVLSLKLLLCLLRLRSVSQREMEKGRALPHQELHHAQDET